MTAEETTDETVARIERVLKKPDDQLADPIQGFMQQRFDMEGDIQKGTRLAATMNELTRLFPD